jgi:predicted membrane chloride channel (bestrophin family)
MIHEYILINGGVLLTQKVSLNEVHVLVVFMTLVYIDQWGVLLISRLQLGPFVLQKQLLRAYRNNSSYPQFVLILYALITYR